MNKRRLMMLLGGVSLPWSLSYPGSGTMGITSAAHASIANLQDGAMTVEGWFKPAVTQLATTACLYDKGHFSGGVGWLLYIGSTGLVNVKINCATTDADSAVASGSILTGTWTHVVMQFDDAGDRKVYIAINGAWKTYSTQTAGDGAIVSDAAVGMRIACRLDSAAWQLSGAVGWQRLSTVLRYTVGTPFTPPERKSFPAVDANTARLFKINEGTGTAIVDYSANAQNATQAGGTWTRG